MVTALLITTLLGQSGGACAVQTTSRLDSLLNPNTGADERFFSRPNGAPNILFLIDTSSGTRDWLEPFPWSDGCPDGFPVGYDNGTAYEPVVANVDATGWPTSTTHYDKEWFNYYRVYEVPSDANFGTNLKTDPTVTMYPSGNTSTVAAAITSACTGANDVAGCSACLTNKGFYRGWWGLSQKRLATGNLLNYSPPRYVAVMQTITQLVRDVKYIRFAVAVSGDWSNDNFTNSPDVPMSILSPFWPACNKVYNSTTDRTFDGNENGGNQRNSVISGITNNNNANFTGDNLTASMLYGAGRLFKSSINQAVEAFPAPANQWPVPSGGSNLWNEKDSNNQRSICDACVFSAVILINASPADPSESAFSSSNSPANGLPSFATTVSGLPATTCDTSVTNKCNSKADELAAWLYRYDFRADFGGTQRISTYVINLYDGSQTGDLMQSIAKQGGGRYFRSGSNAQLKADLTEALDDISSRGQTFATSAVTSIQTGALDLTQLVPRMYPQRGLPWLGELYRFKQRNEFVENVDLNGDGDKQDVFAVDRNNDVVVESSEGFFKKATSFTDFTPTANNANPFWEAADRMRTLGWQNRRIFTVTDPGNDSNENFTHEDDIVEFKAANWSQLRHFLGLEGRNCPSSSGPGRILQALNLSTHDAADAVNASSDTAYNEICARVVINYARGQDLGDEDGDNDRDENRESMMSDIFHSSPVVVEPPPEKFICDLGLSNQCASTLYAQNLPSGATPLANGTYTDTTCGNHQWTDPYDIYRARQRKRDRLVVVGSNGGMLHVFNNGVASGASCSGTAWSATWDQGTGDEEFAFIPPDLMPKLQDMILNGHEYFVDGDVMVRDVWADGSGSTVPGADGFKQWDEFHTMLIGSEGRGGTHYFALELIWPSDTNSGGNNRIRNPIDHAGTKPFRWIFPQPGSRQAADFGKTLFTLNPKPPPIGPVMIATPASMNECGGSPNGSPCAVKRQNIKTREAWITMLAGGWSPGLERGRGVYMVDAYWGVINGREDNLYWEATLEPQSTVTNPTHYMTASIASPIALVDYGDNADPRPDGFFDTAVVGDTIGQLWIARFYAPGALATDPKTTNDNGNTPALAANVPWLDAATPSIVNNWRIARAFEMDKGNINNQWKNTRNVNAFYYLPSIAVDPTTLSLRALIGSGNRQALLEPYSGLCRFDNVLACSKFGCNDIRVDYHATRPMPGMELDDASSIAKDQTFDVLTTTRLQYGGSNTFNSCGQTIGEFTAYKIKDCRQNSGGNKSYDNINKARVKCDDVSYNSQSTYACWLDSADDKRNTRDISGFVIDESGSDGVDDGTDGSLGKDRYYGLWIYGGDSSRLFDETETDSSQSDSALAFDGRRLNDRGNDLKNVTATTCAADGTCSGTVTPGSGAQGKWGWFLDYPAQGIKTATGSAVVASCALWSTLVPGSAVVGGASACVSSVASSGFYQADYLTGEPNCATGFISGGNYVRSMTRSVLTPPPEPATIVQVSTTGQIRYSAQLPEPGKGQQYQVDVTVPGDATQSVYELPVSRSTHECRHTNNGDCWPVP